MSTIKSSDEHLTLNADGTSKDIKFQANGVEKASISSAGAFTSTTIDATKLTGTIPNFTSTGIDDNADATAITIDSDEIVGVGVTSMQPWAKLQVQGTAGSQDGAKQALYVHSPTTTANEGAGIRLSAASGSNEAVGIIGMVNNASGNSGSMTFHTYSGGATVPERMRIDSSGNVAIGHTSTTGSKFAICDGANSQIQFFPEISTDTNLTQHYDPTASAYINAETRAASHSFKIGTTERASIDSSGNLSIGTYANPPSSSFARLTSSGIVQSGRTGTGNQPAIEFFNGNGVVGSIYTGGTTTTYYTSSDYRLKENVNYDWDATTRLKQLKPARFNFKTDESVTFDGFLAHEVSSIVPEAIGGEKDAVDDDGNAIHQGIDQSKLVPLLVKTIQELEARITALEA